MSDFLFEIYTDEIPAKQINSAISQLKTNFEEFLKEFNLRSGKVQGFGTPRRLVIYIEQVEDKEDDSIIEIKGPSLNSAISENNQKLQPYLKFIESNGLTEQEIEIKEVKGNKYVFGIKKISGRASKEILKEVSINAVKSLNFPRMMRWNETNMEFIRPIRNLLSMLGDEIVPVELAGIRASNKTFGFFFDSPLEIDVKNPKDYFTKIREKYIILDFNERKRIVEQRANELANKVNGKLILDEEFLEEIINMTEFPTPFLCLMDIDKSSLPDCIIESIVKDHLKSLPIFKKDGTGILPHFIGVRNGTSDFIENVKKGYERVAKARILDGIFFFNEDKKNRLESNIEALSEVAFIGNLGSLKDKTMRLVKLSEYVSSVINLSEYESYALKRAAYLCKADLLTNVVNEFPELQGEIGSIYAEFEGENKNVADTIKEHLLPKYAQDKLPISNTGKLLSLVDKVDTVVGSILSGVEFSSSKDPYGLRRTIGGIVEILLNMGVESFPIREIIEQSIKIYLEENSNLHDESEQILQVIKERTSSSLKEKGYDYDLVNSILSLNIDLTTSFKNRCEVLKKYKRDENFKLIIQTHKRVRNLISKAEFSIEGVKKELFVDESENELHQMIFETEELLTNLLKAKDYEAIIHLFYLLIPEITRFFENVLVMDKHKEIRNNRLNLLVKLKEIFESFADFSEIVID